MPEKDNATPAIKPIVLQEIKPPVLTEDEKASRNEDIMLLSQMRQDRDRPHPELDGMTFVEYYESNRKKDLSYLPPKRNKQDVRITSGLTREKDTTLVSTALNMNFVPDITAFDKDDLMVNELGDNMSDLVKKSREIENWQKKRPLIYREMVAQGDVFVQELYVEDFREMPLERVDFDPINDKIADFSVKKRLQKLFSGCAVRMVNGKKIYLGSVRVEHVEDQDVVAVLNVYNRRQAYRRYGAWERWENIPTTIDTMEFWADGTIYKSWNLVPLQSTEQIAEVMVFDVARNRFQIYLNGTPMLPANYPLTAICPSGELPFTQGKLEGISDFSYSKGQPSKLKIDQEVHDEVTKLMVEGMRQGRKPPMGSANAKKVYSPDIFIAGKVTPDVKKDDLFSLLLNPGLSQADFSFYQLIKQSIEDKSVNDVFEGDSSGTNTLGQAQQDKQQQMLKLGLAIDGFVNLERRMTWLRIFNILENYTKKYDPQLGKVQEGLIGQYRRFSVSTNVEDGQEGVKQFRFTTDPYPPMKEQLSEEQAMTKSTGKETRIVYMNPEILRTMRYTWFIIINPTPQNDNLLSQLMFIQNLEKAYELFGPAAINQEYAKQRFSVLINEDYSKLFNKMSVMQMLQNGLQDPAMQNIAGNGAGSQYAPAAKKKSPAPIQAVVR